MSPKAKNILSPVPATVACISMALLLLLGSTGAHRLHPVADSDEGPAAVEEASSGDKTSSTDSGPPRRFHAIFRTAAAGEALTPELKTPAAVKMLAAAAASTSGGDGSSSATSAASSARDRPAVDNSTNYGTGSNHKNRAATKQCREGCLGKRSIKDILCTQQRECAMCWDVCNRNHQIRKENELVHRLLLNLSRMVRNESVVTAEIEWTTPEELLERQPHPAVVPSPLAASENVERLSRIARDGANSSSSSVSKIIQALSQASSLLGPESKTVTSSEQNFHQCLVSWEISGGGLTGNLLTETAKVELSLWPNTKYHVHVTCRNKDTDQLIRSAPLLIDTAEAMIVSLQGTTTTTTTTTTMRPLAINSVIEEIDVVQARSFGDADEDVSDDALALSQRRRQSRLHHRQQQLWPMYNGELPENSKEILILGVFVAILAFVLIVLTVVILVRRKQDQIEDRELLIENEVLPKILHV